LILLQRKESDSVENVQSDIMASHKFAQF